MSSLEEVEPRTGAQDVVADAVARARQAATPAAVPEHADVLFRRRRPEGTPVSAWWPVGAFLATSVGVVLLSGLIPAGR